LRMVEGLEASELEPEAAARWSELHPALRASVAEALAAEDIEARRLRLPELTAAIVGVLEQFGYEHEAGPAQVFHCPMALEGAGADWLQVTDETANPYYGESMLRCGSSQRVLAMEP